MKLGYSYRVCSGGADSKVVTVNGGPWTNIIDDKRTLWARYRLYDNAMAITFVADGMVIALSHLLGGARPDDNVTTWIHVPAAVVISGAELLNVIRSVRVINQEGTKNVSEATFINNPVLNRDYPTRSVVPTVKPSIGMQMAFRSPDASASLEDILSHPYQSYYAPYKFIFIYDTPGAGVADLSSFTGVPLEENITILPPSPETVAKVFGNGQISFRLDDGTILNRPLTRKKGEKIAITVEKPGCQPTRIFGEAVADGKELVIPMQIHTWMRTITGKNFIIKDAATGRNVPSPTVTIFDKTGKRTQIVPEKDLRNVEVQISAPGYDTYRGPVNLSSGVHEHRLNKTAERRTLSYRTREGQLMKVTLDGPGATSSNPIEGYSASGDLLTYQGGSNGKKGGVFAWKEFAIGVATAILLGAVIYGCGYLIGSFFGEKENAEETEQTEDVNLDEINQEEALAEEISLKAALKYLDENREWNRDSLIKYPELNGLFEELNSFNISALNRREDLKKSRNFQDILAAYYAVQQMNPKFPEKHNPENDFKITVDTYINNVKKFGNTPAATPAPEAAQPAPRDNSLMNQAKEERRNNAAAQKAAPKNPAAAPNTTPAKTPAASNPGTAAKPTNSKPANASKPANSGGGQNSLD